MADEGKSIVDLSGLTAPATRLVEKVAEAIGVVYEPTKVRRLAKAEADAERIRALGRWELGNELQARTLQRLAFEEQRKQENIESVMRLAMNELPGEAAPEKIDIDWLVHCFDLCSKVSNSDMQILWAKIIAGEATTPGRFSKRTLQVASALDRDDAELFTTLCEHLVELDNTIAVIVPTLSGTTGPDSPITFGQATHLEAAGLVKVSSTPFARQGIEYAYTVGFFGYSVVLNRRLDGVLGVDTGVLALGRVLLTNAGEQLARICGARPAQKFCERLLATWQSEGRAPYSPWPR